VKSKHFHFCLQTQQNNGCSKQTLLDHAEAKIRNLRKLLLLFNRDDHHQLALQFIVVQFCARIVNDQLIVGDEISRISVSHSIAVQLFYCQSSLSVRVNPPDR
jgi:hypothetical protein